MSIVSGTTDAVKVSVQDKDKPDDYFRTTPGGEHIIVVAEGPATLSVRFRAASTGRSSGTLRILRDDGPFSDNPYDLTRDMNAKVDLAAAAEGNATSVERVIHVHVDAGEHRYELAAVKGPPLLVRVFKSSKFDSALAAAPEKNTSATVVLDPTAVAASPKAEEVAPKEPEHAQQRTTPPEIERAPANESTSGVTLDPTILEKPATLEALPEKAVIPPDPNKHKGFSASVKGGVLGFLGVSEKKGSGNGAFKLQNRIWGKIPIALELAWNFHNNLSLFAEGGFVRASRPHTEMDGMDAVERITDIRVVPVVLGASYFLPIGKSRFGLRFRAGGGLAYIESRDHMDLPGKNLPGDVFQTAVGLAGTAGVSGEVRVGPGRFTLEARYLAIRTNVGIKDPVPVKGYNAVPSDLGGLQILGGYRIQF